MLRRVAICAVLFLSFPVLGRGQAPASQPISEFEIGRHTFVDFGPPLDFYEIYLVRAKAAGSSVERITVTPPGGSCMQPAKVETAVVSLNESVEGLLDGKNPCLIPEKNLRRELKRCKKCLVFSGAVTNMRVQCGNQDLVIRSHVLDKDMFDSAPKTPTYTSWTMQLLERLDKALGSNVMDRPAFPLSEQARTPPGNSDALKGLSVGIYDTLFQGAPDKPSDLYRAAQRAIPSPEINVRTNPPVLPEVHVQPAYPPLARLAHVEGKVVLKFNVNQDGSISNLVVESGYPLLRGAAEQTVNSWRFQPDVANQEIEATVEFRANCPAPPAK